MKTRFTSLCPGGRFRGFVTLGLVVLITSRAFQDGAVYGRISYQLSSYDDVGDRYAGVRRSLSPDPFNGLPIILFLPPDPSTVADPVPLVLEPLERTPTERESNPLPSLEPASSQESPLLTPVLPRRVEPQVGPVSTDGGGPFERSRSRSAMPPISED